MFLLCAVYSSANGVGVAVLKPESLLIAVASNFLPTMKRLAIEFEKNTGNTLKLSSGSSGKHYAQIKNGAPFDVFFSADKKRPKLLEQDNIAIVNTRFTYAIGRLALWGDNIDVENEQLRAFEHSSLKKLSIANPRLAPYGAAAQQTLGSLGLWHSLNKKIVRGENINQAYQFVASGNAQLGLVSYAQVVGTTPSNFWLIPSDLHQTIEQQAVIVNDSKVARALVAFMYSEQAQLIIKQQGYDILYRQDAPHDHGIP